MNNNDISMSICIALNDLNDSIIEEANAFRTNNKSKHLKTVRLLAAAACLAVAVSLGSFFVYRHMAENVKLPILDLGSDINAGFGFEEYMAADISELTNGNPWNEACNLSSLPVYMNPVTYSKEQRPVNADYEKMKEYLMYIANSFGLDTDSLEINDGQPNQETREKIIQKMTEAGVAYDESYFAPNRYTVSSAGIDITVNADMSAYISFEDPGIEFSPDICYSYYSEYEDCKKAYDYLISEYSSILKIKDPVMNISGGDRNVNGRRLLKIGFFENSESSLNQILNFNFKNTEFIGSEDGRYLSAIRIYNYDLSDKVGDYPIITKEEALESLLSGRYISSIAKDINITAETVVKTELVYRQDRYFIPYYKFYVEMPDYRISDNGTILKSYGAYYVPAISSEYIDQKQLWSGVFNSREID